MVVAEGQARVGHVVGPVAEPENGIAGDGEVDAEGGVETLPQRRVPHLQVASLLRVVVLHGLAGVLGVPEPPEAVLEAGCEAGEPLDAEEDGPVVRRPVPPVERGVEGLAAGGDLQFQRLAGDQPRRRAGEPGRRSAPATPPPAARCRRSRRCPPLPDAGRGRRRGGAARWRRARARARRPARGARSVGMAPGNLAGVALATAVLHPQPGGVQPRTAAFGKPLVDRRRIAGTGRSRGRGARRAG